MDEKIKESARIVGRVGGISTLKKHGKEHYQKMAEKRWKNKK